MNVQLLERTEPKLLPPPGQPSVAERLDIAVQNGALTPESAASLITYIENLSDPNDRARFEELALKVAEHAKSITPMPGSSR